MPKLLVQRPHLEKHWQRNLKGSNSLEFRFLEYIKCICIIYLQFFKKKSFKWKSISELQKKGIKRNPRSSSEERTRLWVHGVQSGRHTAVNSRDVCCDTVTRLQTGNQQSARFTEAQLHKLWNAQIQRTGKELGCFGCADLERFSRFIIMLWKIKE